MLEALFQATWSPYAAGAGIGVLVCFSFLLCDRPLGASSAYMKARGLLERAVDPHLEEKKEFYREIEPRVEWGTDDTAGYYHRRMYFGSPLRPVSSLLGARPVGGSLW